MDRKKISLIVGGVAAVLLLCVGGYFYAQGDHQGPSVTLATDFEIGYGKKIDLYDLIKSISDQSAYTAAITSGGEVASDGQSTVFHQTGQAQVEVTAVDELGHDTVRTVQISVVDKVPPVLQASDITVAVGDTIDYRAGVTAADEIDGDLTNGIEVDTSQVDETKAGVYPVTYTVSDNSGNQAVVRIGLTIENPDAEEITLNRDSLELDGNDHYQLTADVAPDAWNGSLQWTSSDESVAVVSDGLVSWVGAGDCVISAQADGVTAQCEVSCGYVDVSTLRLSSYSLTLDYDESERLSTKIVPSNWRGEVTWESSDEEVATVSDGVVSWAGAGTCTITVTADGRAASCDVVCNEPEIESLDIVEDEIPLSANGTYLIAPTILPDVWEGEVTWTSSDPSIATVEDGMVRWVSAGTCTVTATAGECTDSVTINCATQGTLGDLISDLFGQGNGDQPQGETSEPAETHQENGHQNEANHGDGGEEDD